MIDITYEPGRRVSIKGHAGYAAAGNDIVCAAISALYCTMIMADGISGVNSSEEMYAVVSKPKAEDTFRVFCKGMKKVAEQYPKYCSFRNGKINLDAY